MHSINNFSTYILSNTVVDPENTIAAKIKTSPPFEDYSLLGILLSRVMNAVSL